MDRFVWTLQGEEDEVIERESVDSAATMRQPVTNDRYFFSDLGTGHWFFHVIILRRIEEQIESRDMNEASDCGLPHHLLVPR